MTTKKIRLTPPQRAFLSLICREDGGITSSEYRPAVNLVRLGLAEWAGSVIYATRIRPTEAGRAYYKTHLAGASE